MPKRFFRRFGEEVKYIRHHPRLQFFGALLHDQRLWHFHRRTLAGGVAIGLFIAFIPLPMQMIYAAALAILFRANVPTAVSLVWITNPVTIPPLLFIAYKIGAWVLDIPPQALHMELSMTWVQGVLQHSWRPVIVGCLILGLVSAFLGYTLVHWVWAILVRRAWRCRSKRAASVHPA
jgi:uncharacterized protein